MLPKPTPGPKDHIRAGQLLWEYMHVLDGWFLLKKNHPQHWQFPRIGFRQSTENSMQGKERLIGMSAAWYGESASGSVGVGPRLWLGPGRRHPHGRTL